MTTISLRVKLISTGAVKTMPFLCTMSVFEANQEIRDKLGEAAGGGDHSLYLPSARIWLDVVKQLQFYELRSNDTVEFRKRHRQIRVKLLDGSSKTVLMDDSQHVKELVKAVCEKLGVANPEEYSFCVTIGPEKDKRKETKFKGSEDNIIWLHPGKFLSQQNVHEGDMVVLKKKFHFSDANIDRTDPVQLNLLYVQARDAIVGAKYPVTVPEAVQFAAIQRQVQSGTLESPKAKSVNVKECLPHEYWKVKDIEKRIISEHGKLMGMTELNAKFRYVQLCRSLKTYGVTFFLVKEKDPRGKRLQPRLLGVAKDSVMRFDVDTKECLKSWPLTSLRRWAASPNSFTLDFGDYEDAYYNAMTSEGEQLSQIIAGYIDIILKRKKFADKAALVHQPQALAITEEVLAPARGKAVVASTIQASKALERPLTQQAVMVDGPERFAHSQSQATARRLVTAHTFGSQGKGEITAMVGSQHAVHHKLRIGSATTEAACIEMESLEKPIFPAITDEAERAQWRRDALLANVQVVQAQCIAHLASTAAVLSAADLNLDDRQLETIGGEINTLTSTLPLVTGNVKSISTLLEDFEKGEAILTDARNFGSATLQYLNGIQAMVSAASTRPSDLYGPAQAVSTTAQKLMEALQCATVTDKQRDVLLEETKKVSKNLQDLVEKAQGVVKSVVDPEGQVQLVEAIKQCATATSRTVVSASVVAPALPSPICLAQLDAARESVLNTAEIVVQTEEKFQPDVSKRLLRKEFAAIKRSLARLGQVARNIDSFAGQASSTWDTELSLGGDSSQGLLKNALAVAFEVVSFEEAGADGERRRALTAEVVNLSAAVKEASQSFTLANSDADVSRTVEGLNSTVQQLLAMASDYKQDPENPALADQVYAELGKTFSLVGKLLNRDVSDELDMQLLSACKNCITSTAVTVGACTMANSQENQNQTHVADAETAINDALTASSSLILATQDYKENPTETERRTALIERANLFLNETKPLIQCTEFHSLATEDSLLKRQLKNACSQFEADAKCLRHITKTLRIYEKAYFADDLQARLEDLRKRMKSWMAGPDEHPVHPVEINLCVAETQLSAGMEDISKHVDSVYETISGPVSADLPAKSQGLITKLESLVGVVEDLLGASVSLDYDNRESQGPVDSKVRPETYANGKRSIVRHVDDVLVHAGHILRLSKLGKTDELQLYNCKKRINALKVTMEELGSEVPSHRTLRIAALRIANSVQEAQYGIDVSESDRAAADDTAHTLSKIMSQLSASATSLTVASKDFLLASHGSSVDLISPARDLAEAFEGLVDVVTDVSKITQEEQLGEDLMDDLIELSSNAIQMIEKGLASAGHPRAQETDDALLENAAQLGRNTAQIVQRCSSAFPAVGEFTAALHNLRLCREGLGDLEIPKSSESAEDRSGYAMESELQVESYPELLKNMKLKVGDFNESWISILNIARAQDVSRMSKAVLMMSQNMRELVRILSSSIRILHDHEKAAVASQASDVSHAAAISQQTLRLLGAAEDLAMLAREWSTHSDNATKVHALNVSGRAVANHVKAISRSVQDATPGLRETDEAFDRIQVLQATLDGIMTEKIMSDNRVQNTGKMPSIPAIVELLENLKSAGESFVKDTNCDLASRARASESLNTLVDSYGKLIGSLFDENVARTNGVDLKAIKSIGDTVLHVARHCQERNLSTDTAEFKLEGMPAAFETSIVSVDTTLREIQHLYRPISAAQELLLDATVGLSEQRHDSPLETNSADINADKLLNDTIAKVLQSSRDAETLAHLSTDLADLAVRYTTALTEEMRKQNLFVPLEKSPATKLLQATSAAVKCIQTSALYPDTYNNQANLSTACCDLSKELRNTVEFMSRKGDACTQIIDDIVEHVIQPIDVLLVEAEVRQPISSSVNLVEDIEAFRLADEESRGSARVVAERLQSLIGSAGGSIDRVTQESAGVYEALSDLKGKITSISLKTKDPKAGAQLMESTKVIASQTAELLRYAARCSAAQNRTDDDVKHLTESAKVVGVSITNLFQVLDRANDTITQRKANVQTLEATVEGVESVRSRIATLDPSATEAVENENDEELLAEMVSGTKTLAALATDLVNCASKPKSSTDEISAPCMDLVAEVEKLSSHMEHVWAGPGIKNERRMMKVSSERLCQDLVALLSILGSENPKERSTAVRSFASSVQNVVSVMTAAANEASKYQEALRETDQAQKELNAAARSIEAAAAKLYELQREKEEARLRAAQEKEDAIPVDKDFHECLLDAARSIADASAALVRSAKRCQKDIKNTGQPAVQEGEMYFDDGTWTEGLVSAARTVVLATQDLCQNTNGFVNGSGSCELVIASAREVSAATTRLITAASARVDPDSPSQVGLREAGKRVQHAAEQLVKASQQFMQTEDEAPVSEAEESVSDGRRETSLRVSELEAQAEILRLEKELEKARNKLANLRRTKYKKGARTRRAAALSNVRGGLAVDFESKSGEVSLFLLTLWQVFLFILREGAF